MQPDSVLGEVKMKTDEVAHWEGNTGEAEAYVCDVVYRVGTVKSHACVECLAGLQVPPDTMVSAPPQTGRSPLSSLAAKNADLRRTATWECPRTVTHWMVAAIVTMSCVRRRRF